MRYISSTAPQHRYLWAFSPHEPKILGNMQGVFMGRWDGMERGDPLRGRARYGYFSRYLLKAFTP